MNTFDFTLLVGPSLGFFVFILHRTRMIEEYSGLLSLDGLLKMPDYRAWKKTNAVHNYFLFLKSRKSTFSTNMAACYYCLITFSSLIICLFGSLFVSPQLPFFFLIIALVGCITYSALSILEKYLSV